MPFPYTDQSGVISPNQRLYGQMPQTQPLFESDPMPPPPTQDMQLPSGSIPGPQSFDTQQEGLRQALSQGLSPFQDPNAPSLPTEYQAKIDQVRKILQPGPREQEFSSKLNEITNRYQTEHSHGLKARLAGLGKGLLMGEGLAGAVRGASNPDLMNLRYRMANLAPLAQAAQQENAFSQAQLGRNKEFSDSTGIDPTTGLETPAAMYKNALRESMFGRLSNQNRNTDSLIANRDAQAQQRHQKYANVPFENFIKAYNSGLLNGDPDAMVEMAAKAGIPNPENIEPKILMGMIKTIVDSKFGVNTLNLQTGETKSTGITSVDKAKDETSRANAATTAGSRQEQTQVSQQKAAMEEAEKRVGKQPLKPKGMFGKPPKDEDLQTWQTQMDDWNKRMDSAYQEALKRYQSPTTHSSPTPTTTTPKISSSTLGSLNQRFKASLPEGAQIIDTEKSPSTGAIRYKVQLANGTIQYMYPKK